MMNIHLFPASLPGFDPCSPVIRRGIALGFGDCEGGIDSVAGVLAVLEQSPRPTPWSSYWGLSTDDDAYVGLCAFKAAPNDAAVVEIAYYTYPNCEGRGVATAMARGLVHIARANGAAAVVAHTLPVANASGTVLRRLGFVHVGTVQDPEDGEVWAWRLERLRPGVIRPSPPPRRRSANSRPRPAPG